MDSSTGVKSKGGTPNKPLTSRPSLSRNTKTGSPTPSPKVATESPRLAAPRGVGPMSKPTATKGATAVKEANAAKSSPVRSVAASPNKSRTVTQRDPASPIKPPAKQMTRPQNGEKGAQQTASLLVTKNEAAKKTAEGTQLNKLKPGQEGGNTTPLKRNGISKREVGKLPENGSLPKDKTLCLQSGSSASVPSKPLATASSPTKILKANSISHKPKQIVPPPEKPVNATSLSTKATKSPVTSNKQGATTSTPVKTASPLVRVQRPTPVSTKVTKTPTSPVKPVNTSSTPTKPRNATPAKPPGNTMSITNQVKVGKRLPTTSKATTVPTKQVNNVPTAIKPAKSSSLARKSEKEQYAEASPVISAEYLQVLDSEAGNAETNKTEKIAELDKSHEPLNIAEEAVAVPVNYVLENTIQNDVKMEGELLKQSELPLCTNESTSVTKKISAETLSQDKEAQLFISLTQEVKSPTKQVTEDEVNPSITEEQMSEPLILSAKPFYEEQQSEKPFDKQLNVPSEYLQEEPRSPRELAIGSTGTNNSLEEKGITGLTEGASSSGHVVNDVIEDDKVLSSIEPPKQTIELLLGNRHTDEEQLSYMYHGTYLNQSERTPIKPLNEEKFTVESVEPLEDVVTSSLEQVTPLEEGVTLTDDELEPAERKGALLKEEQRKSSTTLDHFDVSPIDPHNPIGLLTSSTEELTPSEDEVEVLKDEKQTLQKRMPSSEQLNMEKVACKMDQAQPMETATFSIEPVICSKEEINTPEERFGDTIINAEEPNTYLEKEMPLGDIPQSSAEGKHSEEGQIQSLNLLQSLDEARLSEDPKLFMEPLQSSFQSSKEEARVPIEPLHSLVAEVKPSQNEPLFSAEAVQSLQDEPMTEDSGEPSAEEGNNLWEEPMFSKEPLHSLAALDPPLRGQPLVLLKSTLEPLNHLEEEGSRQSSGEEAQSLQEEPMLTKDPQPSSVEAGPPSGEGPLALLKSTLEPLNNSEEESPPSAAEEVIYAQEEPMLTKDPLRSLDEADPTLGGESLLLLNSTLESLNHLDILSSYHPLTETKEDRTSLEETIRLEGLRSPRQLLELNPHIVSLEDTVPHELVEEESNAFSKKEGEEIQSMGQQGHLIGNFNSTEPVKYEEIYGVSTVESSEYVNKAANMDPEGIHENLPVRLALFHEPLHMMHEPGHGPAEHVIAAEKQLDSAAAEVEDRSNPIILGQPIQESVLSPEEPLTSTDESKTTFVEADDYPEKPIKSSLELVKSADYDEEATKPSIHELMDYPKDFTTPPEKSLYTAMFTTSEDRAVFSVEPENMNTTELDSPHYDGYLGKSETAMPWTSGNNAFVETSDEVNEPSVHVMAPLDSIESVEEPIKHKILIQPEESEGERNMLAPTREDTYYSIDHHHVDQPEALMTSESLLLAENQYSTKALEQVGDLEKSSADLHFYVTLDPTTNQDIETHMEENKPPTELGYVRLSSFTIDNTTNVLDQNNPTEFPGQNNSTETHQASPFLHTFSPNTSSISVLPTEPNDEDSDLLMHPLQNVDPRDHFRDNEREPWVLVKVEELSDFKEESEERPLRPASLNQDGEVQDEQKAEEEQVERASVCSTLSDPQLAAKSSSETSTPEELRTYEDSSSGVESHSDDAATSPQTMLTPDPDLGIHMGQEEGTETPAGTPASNKEVPPPLQIVDIEGQSQSTSPHSIHDSSESNQIVRKKEMEMMASTESREHDYEETAKERGAQRGNDD